MGEAEPGEEQAGGATGQAAVLHGPQHQEERQDRDHGLRQRLQPDQVAEVLLAEPGCSPAEMLRGGLGGRGQTGEDGAAGEMSEVAEENKRTELGHLALQHSAEGGSGL